MRPIRILIVDDAVVVRRLTTIALSEDPAIAVVGTAVHGATALEEIPRLNPDVVVLDIEMPVMNGLDALTEIGKRHPDIRVIMFSTYTMDGAAVTVEALSRGAADYLAKPGLADGPETAVESIRDQLVPKIKALVPQSELTKTDNSQSIIRPRKRVSADQHNIDIIAIASSVGGPAALTAIIPRLPGTFPVPILIVQHMPPLFTKQLAENLNSKSALEVQEAVDGVRPTPGTVWLAPGDFHLKVIRKGKQMTLHTYQSPRVNSCRPSADELFASVADGFGPNGLAVVLTGMGRDGLAGCEQVRSKGGKIIVQDKATSVVWGMAGCVANAGLADSILPVDQIAEKIEQQASRSTRQPAKPLEEAISKSDSEFVRQLVYESAGISIGCDKEYLLEQRLHSVMEQSGQADLASLIQELRTQDSEPLKSAVCEALATNETLFFRDFHPFEALRKEIIPRLMVLRENDRALSIWCIGCASGQEPYSIAMLLDQHFPASKTWNVRIVGCDLCPQVLEKARSGRYSQLEVNRGLPAELLVSYFDELGGDWQIRSDIRSMVEFRECNLVDFAPHTHAADVVFMRNVLIYFDDKMKNTALAKAHRLLKPDGFLLLGNGESVGANLNVQLNRIKLGRTDFFQPAHT